MKSKTLNIVLRVVALIWCMAIPHGVYANVDCADLFKGAISAEALELLRKAHNGPASFRVDILKTNIDGKDKFVVLLGETHIKGKESSDLGKEILKHFDLRGVESGTGSQNALNKNTLDFAELLEKIANFNYKVSDILGFQQSTIFDAFLKPSKNSHSIIMSLSDNSVALIVSPPFRKMIHVFLEHGKEVTLKEKLAAASFCGLSVATAIFLLTSWIIQFWSDILLAK